MARFETYRNAPVPAWIAPLLATLLACLLAVPACGPGGNNNLAVPTNFGGQVKLPAASGELGKTTLLSRLSGWFLPSAYALSGMRLAGAGVPVSLYAIDKNGERIGPILDQTVTDDNGYYQVVLPSWSIYDPDHPWVVAVGDSASGTLMRRFVDDLFALNLTRDIDPATEAAVQVLLTDLGPIPFSEVTPDELAALTDQVAEAARAVSGFTIAETAASAVQAALEAEAVQRRLVRITRTEDNTRPVALAGINFELSKNEILPLRGNADDEQNDPVSYRWIVDLAPPSSNLINQQPPVGREYTFDPDVDGTYRLKLLVTDIHQSTGPADYLYVIVTTPPASMNAPNDDSYVRGTLTQNRDMLVFTRATRDPISAIDYTDVLWQQVDDNGWIGAPQLVHPPATASSADVALTNEVFPHISPDGTLIAFGTNMAHGQPGVTQPNFDIAVVPPGDLSAAIWVTDTPIQETQPSVRCQSPFSCTVVYVAEELAGSRIIATQLADAGGGFFIVDSVALTDNGTWFDPQLTHDGNWVVFAGRDSDGDLEIFRTASDGSMAMPQQVSLPRSIVDPTSATTTPKPIIADQPTANADASLIAYRSLGGIWLVQPDAGTQILVSGLGLAASSPFLSPTTDSVAFVARTDFGTDLFTVQADGTGITQLTTDGTVSEPEYSYDGTRILFRSGRDGDFDFYLR